jgi:cytochrome c-type biogenesis protein CcsB
MTIALFITILFYMLSAAAYLAYLFLQKDFLQKVGYILMFVGFLLHSLSIGYTFTKIGRIPAQNLYETLFLIGWAVAGVFLAFQYKFNLKILGIYAAPLATLILIASSLLPRQSAQVNDLFKSYWLVIHILTIFIGEASFALACGLGILYLIQEHAIKTKNHGFFFKRLPSLEQIDTTGYACIVAGFTMLSIGLITGFVYAKMVWGRFWSWDPKEVWSGITWLLYAALLHERLAIGWRGRRSAITAIIGFAILLFTFLGVNFLFKGHHWAFTRF